MTTGKRATYLTLNSGITSEYMPLHRQISFKISSKICNSTNKYVQINIFCLKQTIFQNIFENVFSSVGNFLVGKGTCCQVQFGTHKVEKENQLSQVVL